MEKSPELKRYIEEWYLTELRWCNMGVLHPETGEGFGQKTKVLSSIPLWIGNGRPSKCSCLGGPGHVEHPLNVLRAPQRLRVEAWEKINCYIFSLCLSCKPLGPGTRSSGIRPEYNQLNKESNNDFKNERRLYDTENNRPELILSPNKRSRRPLTLKPRSEDESVPRDAKVTALLSEPSGGPPLSSSGRCC